MPEDEPQSGVEEVNNIGELYLNAEIVDHSRKFTYRCLVMHTVEYSSSSYVAWKKWLPR